jgi:hypothetical protein
MCGIYFATFGVVADSLMVALSSVSTPYVGDCYAMIKHTQEYQKDYFG